MAVQLTIIGDGMNVDKEITLTQAGKIITFLGSEQEPANTLVSVSSTGMAPMEIGAQTSAPGQRQSLRELIDEAKAVTNPQKIVVLGNYIASTDPETVFTAEAVKALFPKTRESVPKNFTRDLLAAAKAGYIEELPDQEGTYFVTRTGESKLAEGFSSGTARKVRSIKKSTGASIDSSVGVREEVTSIGMIIPDIEGYPNYHKLPTKGAKVMWILAFGRVNHVDYLSPREISYIAGKLRDRIEQGDLNGLTTTAAKKGWLTKVEGANYTLLHKGEEYLKGLLSESANDK